MRTLKITQKKQELLFSIREENKIIAKFNLARKTVHINKQNLDSNSLNKYKNALFIIIEHCHHLSENILKENSKLTNYNREILIV